MPSTYFNITKESGLRYAKRTGDNNKIHLNDLEGYNSLYGEKVCHGCNVFESFLKNEKKLFNIILKKKKSINIEFKKHFSYSKNIIIKKNRHKLFLNQNGEIKAEIKFKKKNHYSDLNQKFFNNYNFYKFKNLKQNSKLIFFLLGLISHHVGKVYPGKNSIIQSITINYYGNKLNLKNGIYSKLKKKGYPFISNFLIYNKILINFETLVRPFLLKNKSKPSKNLLKQIKKKKNNVLILGSSSGLGLELLTLLKENKKIKIYSSYFKNKIKFEEKNITKFKIDIFEDINKVFKILIKKKIGTIYYFPTIKITLSNEKYLIEKYKRIYIDAPMKILNFINKQNLKINFFYPSTIFIDDKNHSSVYSKTKKKAEIRLKRKTIALKNIDIRFPRLPQLNTKQNLNLLNHRYDDLTNILNTDKEIRKDFFFQ